jgi:dihydrofolate synthase/folylpolyglutamate synthase
MGKIYEEAMNYLYSLPDYERLGKASMDIKRVQHLMEAIGSPHLKLQAIHIAGTKGKGSTSAMLESILRRAGFRTGLYTSPHLIHVEERIRVNGREIGRSELARSILEIGGIAEKNGIPCTTFELLTATAFSWFEAMKVDIAVLETGMGGRLDATNVIPSPLICVLTSIGLDHIEILGSTIGEIAREKAGIIKPGSTVICSPQRPEAMAEIEKAADEMRARVVAVGRDIMYDLISSDRRGPVINFHGIRSRYEGVRIGLLGSHQAENAAVAIASVEELIGRGYDIKEEAIREGLRKVKWPGRLQIVGKRPYIVLDGAHNPDSMEKLVRALDEVFPGVRRIAIFGAMKDKDIRGMISLLRPAISYLIATRIKSQRSAGQSDISSLAKELGITDICETSELSEAMERAYKISNPDDLILITGSLYLVGEALEMMRKAR